MLRVRLTNDSLYSLIRDTSNVDTMFGKAHSNDVLSYAQVMAKVREVFTDELKDNKEVGIEIDDTGINFNLLGSFTKLNIDGKFMAFNKPEIVGTITLLNYIDPEARSDSECNS